MVRQLMSESVVHMLWGKFLRSVKRAWPCWWHFKITELKFHRDPGLCQNQGWHYVAVEWKPHKASLARQECTAVWAKQTAVIREPVQYGWECLSSGFGLTRISVLRPSKLMWLTPLCGRLQILSSGERPKSLGGCPEKPHGIIWQQMGTKLDLTIYSVNANHIPT